MDVLEHLEYRGYEIEVVPDYDAGNPFAEDVDGPTLVLHDRAERRFGWTNDHQWQERLEAALNEIARRGVTRKMYGPGGALAIVHRWLKVAHGMPVVLEISALDHSGVTVYLGEGAHPQDPGGWDSGWIGWLFVTREQVVEWGWQNINPAVITESVKASFDEFTAWVSGAVVGYRITDPDGDEIDSCFGIYDSGDIWNINGRSLRDARDVIDADIAAKEVQLVLDVQLPE